MISIAPTAFASSPASVEVDPTGQAAERRQTSREGLAARLGAASASAPVARQTSPTLPPGVLFIEEPSGIKIYVNNAQVQPSTSHTDDSSRATDEVDFDGTQVEND
jgi:hypothetical protein